MTSSERGCPSGSGRIFPAPREDLFEMNTPGRIVARSLNFLSPWIAAGGVFCLARKQSK